MKKCCGICIFQGNKTDCDKGHIIMIFKQNLFIINIDGKKEEIPDTSLIVNLFANRNCTDFKDLNEIKELN